MPLIDFVIESPIERSVRVMQMEGIFELTAAAKSKRHFRVHVPLEDRQWNVGLITGMSGTGKSSVARRLFGDQLIERFSDWSPRSIVDHFPSAMGIKTITSLLSSVGFSSPPSWLRPYSALSNGEQFRVTVARALAECTADRPAVVDEFSSVVDRTVARIGSSAIAKSVRRAKARFVAVTCHGDVEEWLQPDWMLTMSADGSGIFQWRELRRRPEIQLDIERVEIWRRREVWQHFAPHHYMSGELSRAAACFVASIACRPVAFASVISFPHASHPGWREHRLVCLPDFQGVGIGGALSDVIAAAYRATGKPYYSTTGNPAFVAARARSSAWLMTRRPSLSSPASASASVRTRHAVTRLTASFRFVGPPNPDARRCLRIA